MLLAIRSGKTSDRFRMSQEFFNKFPITLNETIANFLFQLPIVQLPDDLIPIQLVICCGKLQKIEFYLRGF